MHYPSVTLVIKHGNWTSLTNTGFSQKIIYKEVIATASYISFETTTNGSLQNVPANLLSLWCRSRKVQMYGTLKCHSQFFGFRIFEAVWIILSCFRTSIFWACILEQVKTSLFDFFLMLFELAVVLGPEIADFLVPKWGLPPCSFNSYLYMFQYGVSPRVPLRSFHKLIMCLCCHMPRLVEVIFLWNSVLQFPRRLLQLQQNPKQQKRQNQAQRRKKLARQKQMPWKRSKKQQRLAMPRMFVCHEVFAPDMPIPVWIVFLRWTFCFFDVCVFHCISHYFSAGCSSCSRTQSSRSTRTKPRDTRNWRGKSRCRGRGQPNSRGELCQECLFVMKSCVFAPDMPIPVWILFLRWTFCFFHVCVFHCISHYFSAGCSSCSRTQSSRSARTKRHTRNWRGKSRCCGRGQRNSTG